MPPSTAESEKSVPRCPAYPRQRSLRQLPARRRKRLLLHLAAALLLKLGLTCAEARCEEPAGRHLSTSWGSIHHVSTDRQLFEFRVGDWPDDGRLNVPTPFAPIVRCSIAGGESRNEMVDFQFNQDATQLWLLPPASGGDKSGGDKSGGKMAIRVETAEKSGQMPDGRIVFSALDARVNGKSARLESHPGNHRIGFWTNADDSVSWPFQATRWGMYQIWLTYSCASPDGTLVEVQLDDATTTGKSPSTRLRSTGSWYRYTTIPAGIVYLESAGPRTLTVHCREKVGAAVMNLKAVILQPACEGQPPKQAADGSVTLHGRDATVQGTMLRWEPAEKKQTLGYWVNASDAAAWTFAVQQPGTFDVEVLQGCGTGQGGSLMVIEIGDQKIRWEVEDTGHFQNFKPRVVGQINLAEPGSRQLVVHPLKIAAKAACDIRQIRLIPRTE